MLPWSLRTFRLPANSWRPSTFWVINVNFGIRFFQIGEGVVAGIGFHFGQDAAAPVVPIPNELGVAREGGGVARSWTRYCFQSPLASRKVGTPLSAETPAPVSTATERA